MKYIYTVVTTLLLFSASAQEKVFNYEIKTIIQDGKNIPIPKGDSYAIVVASGNRGQQMFMMDGNRNVGSGSLMLISKSELKATTSQADGYRTLFTWNRTADDGTKMPTKVTMEVRFPDSGAVFQCRMEQGNSVHIYKGLVYNISTPSENE